MMNKSMLMLAAESVGVVLAGGRSSRMGSDKAALCIGHEPLLLRARRLLQDTGFQRVCLSGFARLGWTEDIVPDLYPEFGPVGGMVSVMRAVMDESRVPVHVLFMPVDTPLMSMDLLRAMLQNPGVDGCCVAGSPLPVLLKTTPSVLAQCEQALAGFLQGRACSVKQFMAPLDCVRVHAPPDQLLNVNTPTEWKAFCCEFENRT